MTKLQVTRPNIYGKGGKIVPVGTVIDSKKVAHGLDHLASKTADTALVVATPEAATEAKAEEKAPVDEKKTEVKEEPKVEQLDRTALEASAKTLGIKFTKDTSDEDLLKAINEKLGE